MHFNFAETPFTYGLYRELRGFTPLLGILPLYELITE
jgi:hypothetical protein